PRRDTVYQLRIVHVGFPILEGEHPKNKYAQNDIDNDAAHHYNKPLPCRFRAEFPWLRFTFKLLGIHRFIDHPGNFHVTTQWQPSYAVFATFKIELEQFDAPGIKKQVEFLHLDPKSTCRQKMPEFMQYNQYRQAQ